MIPLPPLNQPWRRHAACGSLDPELFFLSDRMRGPEARRHEDRAKAICATCPVTAECLAWAIENGERFGVFGGTTPGERKRLVSTT